MRRFWGMVALASMIAVSDAAEPGYPGPWKSAVIDNYGIGMALGHRGTKGCTYYYFRFAGGNPQSGQALVECTRDGQAWSSYLVWPATEKVIPTKSPVELPYADFQRDLHQQ